MTSMPLLESHSLGKNFGQLSVLSGFDLKIDSGEVLGVIGPNGAGKSTMLGLIGGSIFPTEGWILFDGQDITRKSASWRARHGIATSYQVPRPFAGMTVMENLLVPATFAGGRRGKEAHAAALNAMAAAGLSHYANTAAGNLRLLDRKRLEVARALAANPRLLLLDEIAGGLTEAEVPELVETVRTVAASGVTVVWIEHVVHALTAVATRLLCLTYGKILAQGDPQTVLNSPEVLSVYLGIDPEAESEAEQARTEELDHGA